MACRSGAVVTSDPAHGEVWWCDHPEIGRRPVVVLSRDSAIRGRRRAIVAPCTTTIRGLASEVTLDPDADPVPQLSVVNLDSIENLPVAWLVDRLGRLGSDRMHSICQALAVATDC
jgi:mRNA interferase MazF